MKLPSSLALLCIGFQLMTSALVLAQESPAKEITGDAAKTLFYSMATLLGVDENDIEKLAHVTLSSLECRSSPRRLPSRAVSQCAAVELTPEALDHSVWREHSYKINRVLMESARIEPNRDGREMVVSVETITCSQIKNKFICKLVH